MLAGFDYRYTSYKNMVLKVLIENLMNVMACFPLFKEIADYLLSHPDFLHALPHRDAVTIIFNLAFGFNLLRTILYLT